MKKLTLEELNNIETGMYNVTVQWKDKLATYENQLIEVQNIGGKSIACLKGVRVCWWLGDLTVDDYNNWITIYI